MVSSIILSSVTAERLRVKVVCETKKGREAKNESDPVF
jgi:hypothetical protein